MTIHPALVRPLDPPGRQLATVADQLEDFAAADLPLTGTDLLTLAATLRAIAGRMPGGRATMPRPVAGGSSLCN